MARLKKSHKIIIGAVVGLGVLVVVGPFVWKKLNPPEQKATDRIDDLLTGTVLPTDPPAPATTPAAAATVPGATAAQVAPVTEPLPAATTVAPSGLDGSWKVIATDDVELVYAGYRVDEVLAGQDVTATGRTPKVTGSLAIQATSISAAEFSVDIASVKSDQDRRDGQFRGNIMNAEQFPNAVFRLTQPIELAKVPADREKVTVTAVGELTLRDATVAVTFEIEAFITGSNIVAAGEIPVTFADYGITPPDLGFVKTEDNGSVEFLLIFERG